MCITFTVFMVELMSYICLCTFNLYIYSFLCKKFSPKGTLSSVTFYINTWPWISNWKEWKIVLQNFSNDLCRLHAKNFIATSLSNVLLNILFNFLSDHIKT